MLGAGRDKPTLPLNFKSNRAATAHTTTTTAVVQQQCRSSGCNSTRASSSVYFVTSYSRSALCLCVQCSPGDAIVCPVFTRRCNHYHVFTCNFRSNTHRRTSFRHQNKTGKSENLMMFHLLNLRHPPLSHDMWYGIPVPGT